jgi:hypothetical protein
MANKDMIYSLVTISSIAVLVFYVGGFIVAVVGFTMLGVEKYEGATVVYVGLGLILFAYAYRCIAHKLLEWFE